MLSRSDADTIRESLYERVSDLKRCHTKATTQSARSTFRVAFDTTQRTAIRFCESVGIDWIPSELEEATWPTKTAQQTGNPVAGQ